MSGLEKIIEEFKYISASPRTVLDRYLSQGKKVVGCFPVYTPEELVHAGGMIPMGLWGGQVTPTIAGKYNPVFTCSIMRSCLEYGMTGVYEGISCAILPILCDTFRGMCSSWRAGTKIPLIAMIHPQNREYSGAFAMLKEEYQATRKKLEAVTGCQITDQALAASIAVYNEHSATMNAFTEVANDHLDVITPIVRHAVMKSARFIEKAEHTKMVITLLEEMAARPKHMWKGKKVILSGITAEPYQFLQIFSENKIAVVGDDLAQETRLYRTPIPEGMTSLDSLVGQWFDRYGCSMIHEVKANRGKMLAEMAKKCDADAVAICLMRFCDVEEYDYPYVSKDIEAAGLTCLCLEIDQSTQNNEQSRTKIQSFSEAF